MKSVSKNRSLTNGSSDESVTASAASIDRIYELVAAAIREHPTAGGRTALRLAVSELERVRRGER